MLGGRIMQTGAPVQDAFIEMIGPIGAPLFHGTPHFNRRSKHQLSPSWSLVLVPQ